MSSEQEEPPVFLKWAASTEEGGEDHVFIRSDWIMENLFLTIPSEDALRAWTLMCAHRIRTEEGEEEAREFLEACGVKEH